MTARSVLLVLVGTLLGGCLLVSSPDEVEVAPGATGGSGNSVTADASAGSAGQHDQQGATDAASGGSTSAMGDPDAGCEPTTRVCQDDSFVECDDTGTWGEPTPCAFACRAGTCTTCKPGTGRCIDGQAQQCDENGNWGEGVDCPVLCVQGECRTSCPAGSKQCDDKTPQTCVNNSWEDGTECTVDCFGEGECADCIPDDKRCADPTHAQVCDSQGQWGQQTACIDQTCYLNQCSGVCAPGDTQCEDASTLQTCNAMGQFDDTDCAATDETCVDEVGAAQCTGDCAPGQQRCTSNVVQTCDTDGTYADDADCTDQTKACVESGQTASCQGSCVPGLESCEDDTPSSCNDQGSYDALGPQCSSPNFICELDAGDASCVSNPPYNVGEDMQFGGTGTLANNWLVGNWVDIADDVVVVNIGLIAYGHTAACKIRLAIYDTSGGEPNMRRAYTAQFDQPTSTTTITQAPYTQTVLSAGRYWIMAHYTQCSAAPNVYRFDDNSQPDLRYVVSATDPPPSTFPGAGVGSIATYGVNHYLQVQKVP